MRTRRQHILSTIVSLCLGAFGFLAPPVTAQAPNEWTWQGGSNTCCQPGVYGTQGTPAAGNIPSSRYAPATARDGSGNLWLFGGEYASNVSSAMLNDLWKFDPSTQQWEWVSGTRTGTSPGNWGTMGTAASTNIPSPRSQAAAWIDASGNFWLFGGNGVDANSNTGLLNDLWEFNVSTQQWTWIAGSSAMTCDFNTVYQRTLCDQPATTFSPGGRDAEVTWTDSQGNFWLFGGNSYDSFGTGGEFNDFWMFSPSSNAWTFMGGASQIDCGNPGGGNCLGSDPPQPQYGTLGLAAPANNPGGRANASGWLDSSGNLWIFGGFNRIFTSPTSYVDAYFTDTWKYDFSSSQWTWMAGPNLPASLPNSITEFPVVTGTLGVPAAANNPGSRTNQSTWTDKAGNLWLFGGENENPDQQEYGFLDDIWFFNSSTLKWTWMGGSATPPALSTFYTAQAATYGALGVAAPGNTPGGRGFGAAWTDTSGNFWLFGGASPASAIVLGTSNDLWEFQPSVASLPPAIAPTFSPPAGTYPSAQSVTISNGMADASIYYTTDGSAPTSASTLYAGPVSVAATETLNAIAVATGYPDSGIASALYTITPPAATPTFSVPGGTYTATQSVTLSDTTPGATIYYTTDGTTPTTSSTVYSAAISISSTETLSAFAIATGYSVSTTATATYTITPPPSFSIAGTAVSVSPGATAGNTSTITLTPAYGFTGAISLSCAITPVAASDPATCSIPASATISGATAQTTTLTVNTTAAASARNERERFLWRSAGSAALACLLFAVTPMRRRSRWNALALFVALFCFLGGALGCGGGTGAGGTPNPGTTPGSYVITVTGTSGTNTQTGTVSLTVE